VSAVAPTFGSRTLTPEEVERGYNNRAAVPGHAQWFERWAARSREAIDALAPRRDVHYGRNPQETLDLFVPPGRVRGLFVFIHGGWWRALDKADHAFVAPAFVAQGIAVANVNYDLCPGMPIAGIVDEVRRAVGFLARSAARLGIPDAPMVVAGHSAGGHLTAMLHASTPAELGLARHPVAGAVSLSGVHDLTPLVHYSLNSDFKLDAALAARLSPLRYAPQTQAPIVAAVGADETGEFIRQADLLWEAWPGHRPAGASAPLRIPARHHYSVVMDYADPDSALTQATLALF
jgi:arylformamidase